MSFSEHRFLSSFQYRQAIGHLFERTTSILASPMPISPSQLAEQQQMKRASQVSFLSLILVLVLTSPVLIAGRCECFSSWSLRGQRRSEELRPGDSQVQETIQFGYSVCSSVGSVTSLDTRVVSRWHCSTLRRSESLDRHRQWPDALGSQWRRQSLFVDQSASIRTVARAGVTEYSSDDQWQKKEDSSLLSLLSEEQDRQK